MDKFFEYHDKVYHKHLKQVGVFFKYSPFSDDECLVIFEDGYGDKECKRVSVSQLEKVEE